MTQHILLEIRTGRDSQKYADAMADFLSALPSLQNSFIDKLTKKNEILSFEILLDNQNITFYIYCPLRLSDYFKSLISAHYPEATINLITQDILSSFQTESTPNPQGSTNHLLINHLALSENQCYPLKDYRDFKETDTLASLLSHLAKASPLEKALIQFLVCESSANWQKPCQNLLQPPAPNSTTTPISSYDHANIQSKLNEKSLNVNLNLAVVSTNREQAQLFIDGIINAFNILSKQDSNSLKKIGQLFPSRNKIEAIKSRRFQTSHSFHLTIHELSSLFHFPNQKLNTIPNLAWGKNLLGEPPENLPIVRKEFDPAIKKTINVFARTFYKNEFQTYGIRQADRRRHMYVIGKTGTGKSTLLANMAINDLRNNEGLCFIDPHGDAIDILLDYIPSSRINDVVYFNPADGERTVKINLFEGDNVEHRELIASGIVSIFQKLYSYSWGPRLEHFLRNALLTLLQMENARLSDIIELFTDKKFRQNVLSQLHDPVLKSFWLGEFEPLQDRLKNEAVAPILNKVGQFVSSPLVRNVVNADKSSFSIERIMDEGKILLVNLSQGMLGEDNATLLGAMLITKIQLAAMARVHIPEEKRRDFYLYVDEFQNFATGSFNKILSEARKYRLDLILANQYIAQIPEDVQKAIFGNCGSMISFVMGSEDAQVFSREYGEKYSYDDLVSLNRHQIINRISIDNILSSPFPAYTLPLARSTNQNRQKVIRVSRERYATKK